MSDLVTQAPANDSATAEAKPGWHGSFIWYELMTTDEDAAIAFYTKVVGWTAAEQTMADLGGFRYTILSAGEGGNCGVAGLMQLSDEMCQGGGRPGWIGVIAVADADEAARSIAAAGGTVLREPDDIPNIGRFAVVADPGGAVFQIMTPQPQGKPPASLDPQAPGKVSWHELYSSLGDKAAFDFYSAQFGWRTETEMDMGPMGTYRIFAKDGVQLGGMMRKPDAMPVSAWGYYINVEAIDAAAARVTAHGGRVLNGPMEVPGGSWIVQCADPHGAHFNLVAPKR